MQVLICTYGNAGIKRVVDAAHPMLEGVEWLVSWQNPDGMAVPPELKRPDMTVVSHDSRGLSRNRNVALRHATHSEVIISDDDVTYSHEQLKKLLETFKEHPELDFFTFRYSTPDGKNGKIYPRGDFDLAHPKHGYYVSSIELALRRESVLRSGVWFDQRFGLGGELFVAGEEGVLVYQLLHNGLRGRFFDCTLCTHHGGVATGERADIAEQLAEASAAYHYLANHGTWRLRMLLYAMRQHSLSKHVFSQAWRRGIKKVKQTKK